ncbi:two-component sensor histidine kinase [Actinoplanes sp. ATCC 53533]|uniref:sensor histidine kinase n=1 Tax=Actinoplanes sp. ATCC 53533 TaxID=1288362 RepID=UPI000F784D43|nr:histidine kinase [Actinoplanes sp. ATCC 53533]RSM63952.1 two-component sensor histidine kinase [Actinoplanes sp. ATCC 53533]
MIGPAWPHRVTRAHPWLLDVVPATLVSLVSLVPLVFGLEPDGREPSGVDAVAAVVAFALLLVRRRAPAAVLGLTLLSAIVFVAVGANRPGVLVATAMIAVYTVARTAGRRLAIAVAATAAVTQFAISAAAMGSPASPENFAVLAWTGMIAAIGGTVRTWRDYLAATEERVTRAEASKELEAQRRVAEERLRIARELHDVIAHHIALINVQAGIASHLLRTDPDQADVVLGQMRESGRTVLDELSSVLYVLRQPGDEGQPTEPVPDLSRLGQLLDALTAAGLRIHHRRSGTPRPLPTATDLAAYRIIQEGLTNAQKHGTGGTHLLIDYRPAALHIQIRNPMRIHPPAAPLGTGHGLTGMRERAHAVGGSLHAGPQPDGTYGLDARLPAPEAEIAG